MDIKPLQVQVNQADSIFLGLDIGSVSVKTVIVNHSSNIIESYYERHKGQPIQIVLNRLRDILNRIPIERISSVGVTGSGGEIVAKLLGADFVNEIVAHAKAVGRLYPHVRTVVEMGGEDSKLLLFKEDREKGETVLEDFAMNTLCAAGTGSFLDQQAARIEVSIEKEFGEMALRSKHPPRIAGRCSVFAKSDMIHLQQIGTPVHDIVAGLCYAVARSFKSNIGRGKDFKKPVAFQGGVAANSGLVKAFEDILELKEGELIIPEYHASMGAIGAVFVAMDDKAGPVPASSKQGTVSRFKGLGAIEDYLRTKKVIGGGLERLSRPDNGHNDIHTIKINKDRKTDVVIGIDVGSLSTNVVAIDRDKNVVARRYLRTASKPIDAVRRGLLEIGGEIGGYVNVVGVGTTGSGRYMTGDYAGADIVKNEITAQATASIHFEPQVDTIFEIGGQDSKYVSLKNGAVVDFEMNKVCAAGTGSFLEEQAEKLGISIENEFSEFSFNSTNPGKFGDRCTVFMESDLVSYQQKGAVKDDLVSGLAYSIVHNYLNRVVGDRRIGDRILFQGGVAWNKAVVASFEKVTGKKIIVPPHHDVTGAIGVAILALNYIKRREGYKTNFKGFDLSGRKYKVNTFECKACANVCNVSKVQFENERPHFYGARCEIFEVDKKKVENNTPDLFAEREKLMFLEHQSTRAPEHQSQKSKIRIGIPRVLYFYELFPYWNRFLRELGFEVVLSDVTNQNTIHSSMEKVTAETCFPIKVIHGHILELIEKKVDYIFFPSFISMNKKDSEFPQSHSCPLVQSAPYIINAAINMEKSGVKLLTPPILFQRGDKTVEKELIKMGKELGVSPSRIKAAMKCAQEEQDRFSDSIKKRGEDVINGLTDDDRVVVLISRPYNGCDSGLNLDLPKKLREMNVIAIPMDFLPLDTKEIAEKYPDMYWRSGQKMIAAADFISRNKKLNAIYISNFKCGPDSFIAYHIKEEMGGKPYLQLEIDEHSADAGFITRCEAFFDSLENTKELEFKKADRKSLNTANHKDRLVYLPYMCDHAYSLSASLRACGINADVLPESDEKSLEIGRRYTTGKECLPFTITTGDMIKKTKEKGFDPSKIAFFMPTADGPCRFGQYRSVQRIFLDEMGLKDVPIISPDAKDSYGEFGDLRTRFRRLAWRGLVATDILQKITHEVRPYEVNKGETDGIYKKCLKMICKAVEAGGDEIFGTMGEIRDLYKGVSVDKNQRRPIIGLVGEIYLRSHYFSNQDIIRKIEGLGGEVWLTPIGEWIFYCTDRYIARGMAERKYGDVLRGYAQHLIQKQDEHRLLKPFKGMLSNLEEPSSKEVQEKSLKYLHPTFEGEAILSIGKSIDFVDKGVSGIVNIMPFTCMPGMVVTALSKKFKEDYNNVPWLNMVYDGQQDSQAQTRLEAFIYQARQYKDNHKKLGVKN
jgi:predicted CoA-substrate-specific enzyme activase